jgi:hypothetical protein
MSLGAKDAKGAPHVRSSDCFGEGHWVLPYLLLLTFFQLPIAKISKHQIWRWHALGPIIAYKSESNR